MTEKGNKKKETCQIQYKTRQDTVRHDKARKQNRQRRGQRQ